MLNQHLKEACPKAIYPLNKVNTGIIKKIADLSIVPFCYKQVYALKKHRLRIS